MRTSNSAAASTSGHVPEDRHIGLEVLYRLI